MSPMYSEGVDRHIAQFPSVGDQRKSGPPVLSRIEALQLLRPRMRNISDATCCFIQLLQWPSPLILCTNIFIRILCSRLLFAVYN
jgi:hypothetical protein